MKYIFLILSFIFITYPALANQNMQLRIIGLPPDSIENLILLKAISLTDGAVVASAKEQASSELFFDIYSENELDRFLVNSSYISLNPKKYLHGAVSSLSNPELTIVMQDASPVLNNKAFLPTYPPEHGRSLGYNPDHFKARGTDVPSWLGRGFVDMTTVDMVQHACQGGGDNSYKVVESANPRMMAILSQEINLQNSPDFDPAYRVKPRIIAYTHLVKGDFTITDDNMTAVLWIEDLEGNVVAKTTKTGPIWDTFDEATKALAEEFCKGKEWRGTVNIEEHTALSVPNANPELPGATVKGDLSVNCSIQGQESSCSVTYQNSITGAEGNSTTQASGTIDSIATISVSNDDVVVEIGVFNLSGTTTSAIGGSSFSGQEIIQLGGWRGKGKAEPNSNTQKGSSKYGEMTITWTVSK